MAKGFNTSADILTKTRDGQDLNAIWDQYQSLLAAFNATRQPLIDLLTFSVTDPVEDVAQAVEEDFEKASEFGLPRSVRPLTTVQQRAFDFDWYDVAARFTFKFLADATARQIDAVQAQILEADNRLLFARVLRRLFNNVNTSTTIQNVAYNAKPLYNADGEFVPPYRGLSFTAATHNHYVTSGAATVDSGDVEQLASLLEEHGYSRANGFQIVIMFNPAQVTPALRAWRAGVTNQNAAVASYDFVPPSGTNIILPSTVSLFGAQPGPTFAGFDVIGAYGPYLLVQDYNIPSGYMFAFATAGGAQSTNLIGIREHPNASLRGLLIKPGDNNAYPLINSTYIHGLGTGVRTRGAGAIMQITASGTYTIPTQYQ
jgi:hypothetical protein